MGVGDSTGVERRSFLRTAALAGLATAWTAPIIQTVAVPSAFAVGNQSPEPPGTTTDDHESNDDSEDDSHGESDDNSDGD